MASITSKPLTSPQPPAESQRDPRGERSDARLSAIVEAAYIQEAIRR
jgi:hypothetical protein